MSATSTKPTRGSSPEGRACQNTRRSGTVAGRYGYHMGIVRQPTLVQFTDDLLSLLDRRVAATGRSRSELIREAVASYLAQDQHALLDAQLVEGYQRVPETAEELARADDALRDSIAEEPWWTEATSGGVSIPRPVGGRTSS